MVLWCCGVVVLWYLWYCGICGICGIAVLGICVCGAPAVPLLCAYSVVVVYSAMAVDWL